jgi:hypothetical protein
VEEWRPQSFEVQPLFRHKYGVGAAMPTQLRLMFAAVGSAAPVETWVDEIAMITRTDPPTCNTIDAFATPGFEYLDAITGMYPAFHYRFDEAPGVSLVVDRISNGYAFFGDTNGTYSAGVVRGVAGLIASNNTAISINAASAFVQFGPVPKVRQRRVCVRARVCVRVCVCACVRAGGRGGARTS